MFLLLFLSDKGQISLAGHDERKKKKKKKAANAFSNFPIEWRGSCSFNY